MQSEKDRNPHDADSRSAESELNSFDPLLSDTVEMNALPEFAPATAIPEVPKCVKVGLSHGDAVWLSMKSPAKLTENEDSVSGFPIGKDRGLLVVADGLGGHRGGKEASKLVVRGLRRGFAALGKDSPNQHEIEISKGLMIPVGEPTQLGDADYRSLILDQIETTNRKLLRKKSGSATTLAIMEIEANRARSYHVGDSPILIVGQRGQLKYETISHSPVGYAVEAGLMSEQEAISHESRHLVSNVVGSKEMTVELGSWMHLAPRDTVLLASDGLFDNLMTEEIVEKIRSGSLQRGVRELAKLALDRMCRPQPDLPSKPDDLTILAYRRRSSAKADN